MQNIFAGTHSSRNCFFFALRERGGFLKSGFLMKNRFPSEYKKTTFAAGIVFGAFAAVASAASAPLPQPADFGNAASPRQRAALTVWDENDYWGKWSDKYYTNHSRIALTLGENAPGMISFFSVGQEIYSPKDREAEIPHPKDHPYAGYFYVSFGNAWNDNDKTAFSQEIQIGGTGEWSFAEQIQCEFHRAIDEIRPAGWDTQIHKRVVGQAIGDVRHRVMLSGECGNGDYASDMIIHGFGTLGNLRGIFSGGAQFRFGWNLPKDFGMQGMRQSASVTFDPKVDRSFYGFFGVQGDAVLWDKTLTGNNDRDADIYAYPLVAQFSVGLCAIYDRWMISVYQVFRSKDFSSQDEDFFAYGGVKCSLFF